MPHTLEFFFLLPALLNIKSDLKGFSFDFLSKIKTQKIDVSLFFTGNMALQGLLKRPYQGARMAPNGHPPTVIICTSNS